MLFLIRSIISMKTGLGQRLITLICIYLLMWGCSKPGSEPGSLKKKAHYKIGAAVQVSQLKQADFSIAFSNNFSQMTGEYEMKMKEIWRSLNTFSFVNSDYLADYAINNNMTIHGHALLWYRSFPDWFINSSFDSASFELNIKAYIQTVVARYRGKIASWDVANEIFADNGSLRTDTIVSAVFKDPLAFYGRCFRYVRETDPDVKLFYNDYDLSLNSTKRTAVKKMVERFRHEGYPIDGLGDQFHTNVWTDKVILHYGLNDLATTGLLIHISELDIRVNKNKSDTYIYSEIEQQKQADMFEAVAAMFEDLPDAQKYAITTWGVTDKYTWLTSWWHPKEYPLLFDKDYSKKKAYYGFLSGIRE